MPLTEHFLRQYVFATRTEDQQFILPLLVTWPVKYVFLNHMLDHATPISVQQPQTEVTDLSFAAADENISNFTSISRATSIETVNAKHGPA